MSLIVEGLKWVGYFIAACVAFTGLCVVVMLCMMCAAWILGMR